jgi:hypothetical protein
MTEAPVEPALRAPSIEGVGDPRVSVVMPFRDAGPWIEESIRSMLDQTYASLEVVAVDDGSTDDGPTKVAALAQIDPRVRLVREGRNGFVASLNRGIELARGEYIARMDADDASLPDRIARQVAFLDAHPDVGVVGGQILAVVEGRTIVPPWWIDTPTEHDAIVRSLVQRNAIYHPTALLRRSELIGVGGYRPAFTVVQDYDLWLRLAERTRLANLPERVLRYRFHGNQATERNLELAYLCTWTARFAAAERKAGRPDPVGPDTVIDRRRTAAWGLDPNDVEAETAWIRDSHAARRHLWTGRRLRAWLAFAMLVPRHPRRFWRRAMIALRSRGGARRSTSGADVGAAATSTSPACPASR